MKKSKKMQITMFKNAQKLSSRMKQRQKELIKCHYGIYMAL